MKPRQQASRATLDLIERFEGYRRTAARLEDGRWTIGYGHTKTARPGAQVSEADAEALLIYDLMEVSGAIGDWVYTPLNQNQFDALCAFVFNIGLENFRQSNVLRRLNEGALLQAACAMEMWRRVDFEGEPIVLDALVRRRAAEKALFLTPTQGFLPSPSQVLKPKVDTDLTGHVPRSRPVVVAAPLEGVEAKAERMEPRTEAEQEAEDPPFATQVAADTITQRLQSILNERDSAPLAEPAPAPSVMEPAGELDLPVPPEAMAWSHEPAELMEAEHAPMDAEAPWPEMNIAERAEAEAPLFSSEPMTFEGFESRRVAHHDFQTYSDLEATPTEPIKGFNPLMLWISALALGLVVFAGGIFFGFSAKNTGSGAVIGWGLGLLGIVFVATAVYFLLERLGGREEP
jgi:lysozyme